MNTEKSGNLEARTSNQEIIGTMLIPGRLSKRLMRDLDPKTQALLYKGMAITGLVTQAAIYSPIVYGAYKTLEAFFN